MRKHVLTLALVISLVAVRTASAQVDVTTFHNDNLRTGWNASETTLTPALVNSQTFKLLFKWTLDDQIYSQPLYLSGVGSPAHNIVYATTVANSVYAFDADNPNATAPLWHVNFGTAINRSNLNESCTVVSGNIGIIGTPVIDRAAGILYVVAMTHEGSSYFHRVHALDVATGAEKPGSPVTISFPGFDVLQQLQRTALALAGGKLYVTYSSHCDNGTYHGYVVEFDATTLAQLAVFNTSPSGNASAIWQSGVGPVIDGSGNVFVATSNGSWDGVTDFGESFVKLASDLSLLDWFTPTNWADLNTGDLDINASGLLYLPGTSLLADAGKQGILYLANANNLGHLAASPVQLLTIGSHISHSLVYWQSAASGPLLYSFATQEVVKSFHFNGSTFDAGPFQQGSVVSSGSPGGILSISSNGGTNGIVWANERTALRAYNADNLATELWNSTLNAADGCGGVSKNAPPTIANGKVFLSSFAGASTGTGQICIYGLSATAPAAPANLTATEGDARVLLSWDKVTGAGSYTVLRGLATGGPYTSLVSGLATNSYTDSTAANGTTYFYVVDAVNGGAASANSNEASATPAAGLLVLSPIADAYVRDGTSAAANFGGDLTLQIKNTTAAGNNRRTFLRFDLSSLAGSVGSAKLRLYGANVTAAAADSAFAVASNTWTESGLTWNNQPALGTKQGGSVSVGTGVKYYEWDVSAFAAAQKGAGTNLLSLGVTMDAATNNGPGSFSSREALSNPPRLVVQAGAANAPPTVATAASASPNPVNGTTTALSVLGADDGGEAALTYTWSTVGTPPAAVSFSPNGTNAAKNSTATFTKAGSYSVQVVIRDAGGATATSSVGVTVNQTLTSITVTPAAATVAPGGQQQFTGTAKDQFGSAITPGPAYVWSVSGGGTISSGGLFTAGATAGGPFTVTAASGALSGTASVTIASSSTTTLGPVADAYVRDGSSATTNFGADLTLQVKNTATAGNNRRFFIRFDTTSVTGTVSSAKLRIFGNHPTGTTTDSAFAVASNSWTESGLTWNNQPALGAKQGASVTITTTAQYYELDVSAFVKSQRAAGVKVVSVAVTMDTQTNNTQDSFNSKEASNNRPQLVVISGP